MISSLRMIATRRLAFQTPIGSFESIQEGNKHATLGFVLPSTVSWKFSVEPSVFQQSLLSMVRPSFPTYTSEVSRKSPLKKWWLGKTNLSYWVLVTFSGANCLVLGVYSDVSLFPFFHNCWIWHIHRHFESNLWRRRNRLLNLQRYHQWITYINYIFSFKSRVFTVNIGNTCKQCDNNKENI